MPHPITRPRWALALLPIIAMLSYPRVASLAPPTQDAYVTSHLAGPAHRIYGSPSTQALNIVILGDGFTADPTSMAAYRRAAQSVKERLLATAPFKELSEALTIYRVDVISDQAGIDVPEECSGARFDLPVWGRLARSTKNPANSLETTLCSDGETVRYVDSRNPARVWDFALSSGVYPQLTIVLANDWMFGAAAWPDEVFSAGGGGIMYATIGENLVQDVNPNNPTQVSAPDFPGTFPGVAVHETGHLAPFLLLDEYGQRPDAPSASDVARINRAANVTTTLSSLKWKGLVPPSLSLPTVCPANAENAMLPDATAVQGGALFAAGVYHPRCECRMNNTYNEPFCIVCRQKIVQELAERLPIGTGVRLILDSLRLQAGVAGFYWIEYSNVVAGRTQISRWPRGAGVRLKPDRTIEPGEVLLQILPVIGSRANRSAQVVFDYRLLRSSVAKPGNEVEVAQQRETLAVPMHGGRIHAINTATHRLTLAVAVR